MRVFRKRSPDLGTLKDVFPCKKLRRSRRLQVKDDVVTITDSVNNGPLGSFEVLPLELKFVIFTQLTVDDLSILTLTSKVMRNMVELYRNTAMAQRYIMPETVAHSSVPASEHILYCQQFRKLGLLMKRSTCLYTTRDRLELIRRFIQKYLCSFHNECEDPCQCIALVCCGQFLHTVIAGWDDKECIRTYEALGTHTLMLRNLNNIVKGKPGSHASLEMHVRLFFRRLYLNNYTNSKPDLAFWLTLILKPFPMVHQARVLYLLCGPISNGEIQWYDMCERTADNSNVSYFEELARSFQVLYEHSRDWTEDAIISVIEELTNCPDDWLAENVAQFLYMCGDNIALKVLNSKAINGRITELASIITSMCLVCTRHEQPIKWVIDIVNALCRILDSTKERITLLNSIIDMFREILIDMHEFGDTDDEAQDMNHMLEAQANFTKHLFQLAFRNLLPS